MTTIFTSESVTEGHPSLADAALTSSRSLETTLLRSASSPQKSSVNYAFLGAPLIRISTGFFLNLKLS